MALVRIVGVLFIVAWLVLWLAVKITFAAVHLLLVIGVIMLIAGLFSTRSKS